MYKVILSVLFSTLSMGPVLCAATKLPPKFQLTFKSKKELKLFTGIGAKPELTPKVSTKKGSGALVVEPGRAIEMPIFQKADGVGTISVSFYDDMTVPVDADCYAPWSSVWLA